MKPITRDIITFIIVSAIFVAVMVLAVAYNVFFGDAI